MALWQISFLFLPSSLVADFEEVPVGEFERIGENLTDVAPGFELPPEYASAAGRLLRQAKGWSQNMEYWGNEKSDDLTIWRKDGKLTSVELRLDVRKLDDILLDGILALAASWGCVLVERRYRKVCRMEHREFRALICGHPHRRALQDPQAWLPVLAEEVRRDEKRPPS